MIQIRRTGEGDPLEFEVIVREGNGETRHHVMMARDTYERLSTGSHTPERCLEAAFRFLLDREPKESILSRFDVSVISRYFSEFERSCHAISRGPDRSESPPEARSSVFSNKDDPFAGSCRSPVSRSLSSRQFAKRGSRGTEAGRAPAGCPAPLCRSCAG
jgi:hypothetical protein